MTGPRDPDPECRHLGRHRHLGRSEPPHPYPHPHQDQHSKEYRP
ncbi:hypothetical protein ACFQ9U_30000 [Streptomyces sp. NPDC056568]